MKSLLVLMGGIIESFDAPWWTNFLSVAPFEVSFAFSTWHEYPLVITEPFASRTILRDQEYQAEVAAAHEVLASQLSTFPNETKPANTLLMWHKWSRFNLLLPLGNFDLVIKTRADLRIDNELIQPLADVLSQLLDGDSSGLAIPCGGDWRLGINDIFAAGRPQEMAYYLDILRGAHRYYTDVGFFHPESMLRYHLFDVGGKKVKRFRLPFKVRGNRYNEGHQIEYVDACPLHASLGTQLREEIKAGGNLISGLRKYASKASGRIGGTTRAGRTT